MAQITLMKQVMQFVACVLLTAWFCFQAFEIYQNRDRWGSMFYSAYGSFDSWWNKQYKRTLMSEFAYDMPDQKLLMPYKSKAAVIFGYACTFGSALFWTGEKFAVLILMIALMGYSFVLNGPMQQKT